MNNDVALFCPHCASASVSKPSLAGGQAKCSVCSWEGKSEELAHFPFKHDFGQPEKVFRAFFTDFQKVISGPPILIEFGTLLIKWGFLEEPTPKTSKVTAKLFARYMEDVFKAVALSVVATRAAIEKERCSEPEPLITA